MMEILLDKELYKCECFCRFKTEEALNYHQYCHNTTDDNFKCPECFWTCKNWFAMRKHLWNIHNIDVEIFYCETCGFRTPLIPEFITHKSIHEGNDILCVLCGVECQNTKEKKDSSQIDVCTHSFIGFRRHVKHDGVICYLCILGDFEATSLKQLQKHCFKHLGKQKIQCSHCDFSTFCYNNFLEHQYLHSDDKPFKCHGCPAEYQNINSYQFHLRTVHSDGSFTCSDCQYSFTSDSHLKIHLRLHKSPIKESQLFNSSEHETLNDSQDNQMSIMLDPIKSDDEFPMEVISKGESYSPGSCDKDFQFSHNEDTFEAKSLMDDKPAEEETCCHNGDVANVDTETDQTPKVSKINCIKNPDNLSLPPDEFATIPNDSCSVKDPSAVQSCKKHVSPSVINGLSSKKHGKSLKDTPKNVRMKYSECKNGLIDWKIDQLESVFKDHVYMCTVLKCKCRFKTLKGLQYHHLCHDIATNFKCPECSWISRNWQPMKKHLWENHKIDIELFICEICGYKTSDIPKLTAHKNTHPESALICIKCGMETVEKPELSSLDCIHYFVRKQTIDQTTHLTYKLCDYKNNTNRDPIKNHLRHSGKYKCKDCDFTVNNYYQLRVHQRAHLIGKLIKCSYCLEHFSDKLYYRIHLKNKHSINKFFPCSLCNHVCFAIEDLKSHISLHKNSQLKETNEKVSEKSDSVDEIQMPNGKENHFVAGTLSKSGQESSVQPLKLKLNGENRLSDCIVSSQNSESQQLSKLEMSKLEQFLTDSSELNSHSPFLLKIKEEIVTNDYLLEPESAMSSPVSTLPPETEMDKCSTQDKVDLSSQHSIKIKEEIKKEVTDKICSSLTAEKCNSSSCEDKNKKMNIPHIDGSELVLILFDDQNNVHTKTFENGSKQLNIVPLNSLKQEYCNFTLPDSSSSFFKKPTKKRPYQRKHTSAKIKTPVDEKIEKLESIFESYKHICPMEKCNCRFKTLEGLTYHHWCHNIIDNNFKCPECSSTSRNWQPMKKHLWEKHRYDVELFECDLCSYKTACIAQLTSHKNCHSEKQASGSDPMAWRSCSRIRLPK